MLLRRDFPERLFVKSKRYPFPAYHHRPPNQIRICSHQPNRFLARWRMIFHIAFAVHLVPRIQKQLVIAIANQRVKFGCA